MWRQRCLQAVHYKQTFGPPTCANPPHDEFFWHVTLAHSTPQHLFKVYSLRGSRLQRSRCGAPLRGHLAWPNCRERTRMKWKGITPSNLGGSVPSSQANHLPQTSKECTCARSCRRVCDDSSGWQFPSSREPQIKGFPEPEQLCCSCYFHQKT